MKTLPTVSALLLALALAACGTSADKPAAANIEEKRQEITAEPSETAAAPDPETIPENPPETDPETPAEPVDFDDEELRYDVESVELGLFGDARGDSFVRLKNSEINELFDALAQLDWTEPDLIGTGASTYIGPLPGLRIYTSDGVRAIETGPDTPGFTVYPLGEDHTFAGMQDRRTYLIGDQLDGLDDGTADLIRSVATRADELFGG